MKKTTTFLIHTFIQRFIQRSFNVVGSFTCSTKLQRSWSAGGLLVILLGAGLTSSRAQNTWTQKADFGGGKRYWAVGFSIGNKGYIGTGNSNTTNYINDFWEYDPLTDVWTQKASLGGEGRNQAVGFSIGSKGYIGTGNTSSSLYSNDFWEYNPATNAWTQKANFAGTARNGAVGFSIGSKGYIGTGAATDGFKNDLWEYDPITDAWTQKTDLPGDVREWAVGFSVGSKGYIGTGWGTSGSDWFEYDPSTNAWTQKGDFPGPGRYGAVGFCIGDKGYLGTGHAFFNNFPDFWEYDPSTDTWTRKANSEGTKVYVAVGFSIGSKGYIGTGQYNTRYKKSFWEYTPESSSCSIPSDLLATNIASASATLNWSAVSGAVGYKFHYRVSGTTDWTNKTTANTSETITGLSQNTAYQWAVETYCQIVPTILSGWSSKQDFTTAPLRMSTESLQQVSFQIYPNPAEDHATIQYTLAQSSHVYIKVYDVSGKEIAILLNDDVEQGEHSVLLNTNQFSKGVYTVKMISDFGTTNQKLIVQ